MPGARTHRFNCMDGGSRASSSSRSGMDKKEGRAVEAADSRPASFLDILKSWFLCGWIANKALFKPRYMEVVSRNGAMNPAGTQQEQQDQKQKPYVRPSRWTQLVRKCRARFRRNGSGCMQVMMLHQEKQHDYRSDHASHYYKMDSYERNFDRGREFWEDLPMIVGGHPLDDSGRWSNSNEPAHGLPADSTLPDPVWMLAASQEDLKEKAAAIARARENS